MVRVSMRGSGVGGELAGGDLKAVVPIGHVSIITHGYF